MIYLRILVGRHVRLTHRTSPARLRAVLDLIRLELNRVAPTRRIVVVADYGDISAILLRREPINVRTHSVTVSHSA